MPEKWVLRQYQALPLKAKVTMSINRIEAWYEHFEGNVYVSFSGGKDSTVLAHLVHKMYPHVPLVFVNTGLEYPEIQAFAKKMGAEFIRPKVLFSDVISKFGYPVISKEVSRCIRFARSIKNGYDWKNKGCGKRNMLLGSGNMDEGSLFNKRKWLPLCNETNFKIADDCCNEMKKKPGKEYVRKTGRKPIMGTLTEESRYRELVWIHHGCNWFEGKSPVSNPISFWTEQDILTYIKTEMLEIASVYGNIVAMDDDGYEYDPLDGVQCKLKCSGCPRTGCIFCGFACHREMGETRFQRLARTHPKQYEYCMGGGQWADNPGYDPVAPEYDGEWKNWNPKKIWVPSKQGLGMKHVFDEINEIYGKDFIRYE